MEYGVNTINQGYAKGQFQAASLGAPSPAAVPPTIASAVGRIDHLNERLSKISAQLAAIANAVGSPYPANNIAGEAAQPQGIVYRLNDGTDTAHRQCGEIEELIGAIGRALG